MDGLDFLSLARIIVHTLTAFITLVLFFDELRRDYTKTDLIVWLIYIVLFISNVLMTNYFIGVLGGRYFPGVDGPRLVRLPGLLTYAALANILFLLRQQRVQKRYYRQLYHDQLETNQTLKDALGLLRRVNEDQFERDDIGSTIY